MSIFPNLVMTELLGASAMWASLVALWRSDRITDLMFLFGLNLSGDVFILARSLYKVNRNSGAKGIMSREWVVFCALCAVNFSFLWARIVENTGAVFGLFLSAYVVYGPCRGVVKSVRAKYFALSI
jgi:hypothetical protein